MHGYVFTKLRLAFLNKTNCVAFTHCRVQGSKTFDFLRNEVVSPNIKASLMDINDKDHKTETDKKAWKM